MIEGFKSTLIAACRDAMVLSQAMFTKVIVFVPRMGCHNAVDCSFRLPGHQRQGLLAQCWFVVAAHAYSILLKQWLFLLRHQQLAVRAIITCS
jgi:hypothetical protein